MWAWTGGAAAAVMDLGRRGVGGGTVATTTSHLSTYRRYTGLHDGNSCGLAAPIAQSANLP